jgi:hypothetical protein
MHPKKWKNQNQPSHVVNIDTPAKGNKKKGVRRRRTG